MSLETQSTGLGPGTAKQTSRGYGCNFLGAQKVVSDGMPLGANNSNSNT